ncbi:MAG: threonylcarbamoyl-AMP synthase [Candidatus Omnitrophica bacterium CG11_big_fil_rev_8_21_14_0_20_64_10]|nr:MAG: threonylcarbamoyl-AMP synthase [Candidatus Omnitrophica bacterium CG11_big_fil_rev_8_21_14_0_20_64_10]
MTATRSHRTRLIRVDARNPEPALIKEAAVLLRRGGLVAFPTETVYGLGVNFDDPQAVQMLYQVKERPFDKQVTLLLPDIESVRRSGAEIPPAAERLMKRFWPGPMTLVLGRTDGSTTGFRVPDHPVTLALLQAAGVPVAAPSANRSGRPPAVNASQVLAEFDGDIDMIVDSGPTAIGAASTVVRVTGPQPEVLRAGANVEAIQALL